MTRNSDIIDLDEALHLIGGDITTYCEVAALFLHQEYPRLIKALEAAVESRNPTEMHFATHALKSSLLNISAKPAIQATMRLEQICKRAAEQQQQGQTPNLNGLEEAHRDVKEAHLVLAEELSRVLVDHADSC